MLLLVRAGGMGRCGVSQFQAGSMTNDIERRKSRRIAVSVPIRTTNPALGNVVGVTRDLCLSGAFFYIASDSWKLGASIEYVLELPSEMTLADPLAVLCTGRIVRVERLESKVGIAVQIESFSAFDKPLNPSLKSYAERQDTA